MTCLITANHVIHFSISLGGEPTSNIDAPVYALNVPYNVITSLSNATWESIAVNGVTEVPKTSTGVIMAPINSKGDRFYYQGGLTCPACPPNSGHVFDLNRRSWRKVNDEPVRYGAHAFLGNDTINYFGGVKGDVEFGNVTKPGVVDRLKIIETSNFVSRSMLRTSIDYYIPGLYYHATAWHPDDGSLTVIGGLMHDNKDLDKPKILMNMTTYLYILPSKNLYLVGPPSRESVVPEARFGHTLVYNSAGQAVLFGGCDLSNKPIDSNIWTFSRFSWTPRAAKGEPPSPRCMHSVVVIDDYMVVLFGKNGNETYVDDPVKALNMRTWEWTNELYLESVSRPSVSPNANAKSSGLSAGAIAGIVVGAIAAVIFVVAIGWLITRRKKTRQQLANNERVSELLNHHEHPPHYDDHLNTSYTSISYNGQTPFYKKSFFGTRALMLPDSSSEARTSATSMTLIGKLQKPDAI
ncbi:uncharacterized protein BYT42DRAFT_410582 [Radiomyces spectabilis]|uniref:uncharacterized protein n=1 Tax=Radiomyces spectabilis TaxID=64574 RepID=UPI00221EAC86|nr:uncharacterized protein BYT42DRAFT_410582 [Radiomyces spectabilis]KAI8374549.1 hypothetical protein BYT42DRAFT_410582 [Radiomyces spectabilis]